MASKGNAIRDGAIAMKLDHVVYFTMKTPKEIIQEQQSFGYHVVLGGQHKQWGTQNVLMYVQNAYIEWLTVDEEQKVQASSNPLIELYRYDRLQEAWGSICLSVQQIEQLDKQLTAKGYETSGVIDAERMTTAGEKVTWKMLFIEESISNELPFPFFIEWEQTEEERRARLRTEGAMTKENDKLKITNCYLQSSDSLACIKRWSELLNLPIQNQRTLRLENCLLTFMDGLVGRKNRLMDVSIHYES